MNAYAGNQWVRLVGGVLLAAGAAVMFVRDADKASHVVLMLIALVPAAALYALGLLGSGGLRTGGAEIESEAWEVAYPILGTLLGGAAVAELELALGADNLDERIPQGIIFLVVAGLAFTAAALNRVPVLTQIGGFALLLAWLSLLGKVFSIDSAGTYRTIIVVYAVIALVAAIWLGRAGRPFAPDLVCVAGVTLLVAALIPLAGLAATISVAGVGGGSGELPQPSDSWNVIVLVEALALFAYGARTPTRGPAYVGALALVLFVGLVGAGVVELAKGDTPAHPGGWAIGLLVLGAAGVAIGFARRGGTSAAGPVPPE